MCVLYWLVYIHKILSNRLNKNLIIVIFRGKETEQLRGDYGGSNFFAFILFYSLDI